MTAAQLSKTKRIHFIGIGGIGVSAIARMMLLLGKKVSGSDRSRSAITDELVKKGAIINYKHGKENVPVDADLVVYTVAVPKDNLELVAAKKLNIPQMSYPQVLGVISEGKFTIAVSGTHGKTTTTAMIGKILIDAGMDPTVIVGSLLKEQQSNFIAGKGQFFVVEACEYKRSFLNLSPKILVITNIDNDHLDYYKNLAGVQKAFQEMAVKLGKESFLVCNTTDQNIKPIIKNLTANVIDYKKILTTGLKIKLPGKHNIENSQAALAVANILKIKPSVALLALKKFHGTWRRFEYKGKTKNGVLIYDDYGHHPTEIKATLAGARSLFPKEKITIVFQPHLYSRTKLLLNDFAKAFGDADRIILAPIYAAREKPNKLISSKVLSEKIRSKGKIVESLPDFNSIKQNISKTMKKGEILITMGAGDIFEVGERLLKD